VVRRVREHAIDLELRADNPATRTRTRKLIATTRATHYRRISWVELLELSGVIDRYERDHAVERSSLIALHLMMLTLVRPSELREARRGEVDLERHQWIIPAERMKGRVRHIVPLSSQVLQLFRCQRQSTGHTEQVFSTPNHRGTGELPVMSNGCLSMLLRRMVFQGRIFTALAAIANGSTCLDRVRGSEELSSEERRLLREVCRGCNSQEIARQHGLTQ
jgi:integrase